MSDRLNLTVKSELAAFKALTPAVAQFLEQHAVSTKAAYTTNLVIEEIVLNSIEHASPSASSDEILVQLRVLPDHLVIRIEDDGAPFDPHTAPELKVDAPLAERRAGGMGLHLVRNMVDELRYERIGDQNRIEAWIATSAGVSAED